MRVTISRVVDLTKAELEKCRNASFGRLGLMCGLLDTMINDDEQDAFAIMLSDKRKFVGWALVTPVVYSAHLGATDWTMRRSRYTVQVFVLPEYRLRGYGSELMKWVTRMDPRPHVIPHDTASGNLFGNFSVTATRDDRYYIKRKPKAS